MKRARFIAVFLAVAALAASEKTPAPPPAPAADGDVIKGRGIRLFKKEKRVELDAVTCVRRGFIEYLVCQKGMGKDHESVFQCEAKPRDIQLALLMLGLKQGLPGTGPKAQGDPTPPTGDPVEIVARWNEAEAVWTKDGKEVRTPVYPAVQEAIGGVPMATIAIRREVAEALAKEGAARDFSADVKKEDKEIDLFAVLNGKTELPLGGPDSPVVRWPRGDKTVSEPLEKILGAPAGAKIVGTAREAHAAEFLARVKPGAALPGFAWIFAGSRFERDPRTGRDIFLADVDGQIVGTCHDPGSIIDISLAEKGLSHEEIQANEKRIPVEGTPAILDVRPAPKAAPPESKGR